MSVGSSGGQTRVDVGAWAALVLGVDGGPGSADLCRPLWLRPDLFVGPAAPATEADAGSEADAAGPPRSASVKIPAAQAVHLAIRLVIPDDDITRAHAETLLTTAGSMPAPGARVRSWSPEATALASNATDTLVDLLRALGGESSAAALELDLVCGF